MTMGTFTCVLRLAVATTWLYYYTAQQLPKSQKVQRNHCLAVKIASILNKMSLKTMGINDLPLEMLLEVFKYLSLDETLRCSKICLHWRETIARHIVVPEMLRHAESYPSLKNLWEKKGWTEECYETELIFKLYNITLNPTACK